MSWKAEIREAVRDVIREMMQVSAVSCTVRSVDRQAGTIVATDTDGLDYSDVRLRAVVEDGNGAGLLVYPVVGSQVVVSILDGIDTMTFVSQYSELEQVVITTASGATLELTSTGDLHLNGIEFGGMLKVEEVVKRLNRLEKRMTTHQHLIGTNPTLPDLATNSVLLPTVIADLENTRVKHG